MQAADPIRASSATIVDDVAFTFCLSIFAVSLAVSAALASTGGREASAPAASMHVHPQPIATFAGSRASRAPVCRLPPISVSASPGIETAGIDQDDRRAQVTVAGQGSGKPSARTLVAFRDAQD